MMKTKKCCICNRTKAFTQFHKNLANKDNHQYQCKICCAKYQKRYSQTKQGREARNKADCCRRQSKKFRISQKHYRLRHPKRMKAKNAVNNAIRKGELPRPDTLLCINCFEQAKDYHHPSYEPEHKFKVVPVCKKCHRKIHYKKIAS